MTRGAGDAHAIDGLFERLRRAPDVDGPELLAYDATDRLLLETAESELRAARPGDLVVIGDRHGAITLGAAQLFGASGIRVHQDPLLGQRALDANAAEAGGAEAFTSHDLGEPLLAGAELVLVQLPRGLDALDEIAWAIARWAAPGVRVFAGGRVKHMTLAMNDVLGRSFERVSAGLARRKSRVLTAERSRPADALGPPRFPAWGEDPDLPFRIAAHGAAFGGPQLDHGSRLLLESLGDPGAGRPPRRILDLGCGNGVLAVSAALRWPEAEVIASDQSAAAVASTRLTAERAGVAGRVSVHRADATEAVPDGWAELILLNPPFHSGAAVIAETGRRLVRSCSRVLAPGGELRLVHNSHLEYRGLVERVIGGAEQISRGRTFTVLSAIRR